LERILYLAGVAKEMEAGQMCFRRRNGCRGAGVLAVALFFASGVAFGQAQTGNVYARATDDGGQPLPGASVTLSGIGAPVTRPTDLNGEVRFLGLSPGVYALEFVLPGFTSVDRKNVTVAVAQNTGIDVTMKMAAVRADVVVTGESQLLDARKTGTSTVVSKTELDKVPTARDPWVILQTVPGVQIDRVNVGGSYSGQQSYFFGKGDSGSNNTYNLDGVNITDMSATGTTSIYYDFDSFAELQMTIGGSDASIQTPGVQLNMVTKRGTNDVHGSVRIFVTDRKFESTNIPEELANQLAAAGEAAIGNQINSIQDYGAELGGPLVKDKLWLWGAYGRDQIDKRTSAGYPNNVLLENINAKLNAQLIPSNTFSTVYQWANKTQLFAGVGPLVTPEASLNQSGPSKIYKIEDSQVFGGDLFVIASYARFLPAFQLESVGQGQAFWDENGVQHYATGNYSTERPQTQFSVTPSFFLRTGKVGHEVKAGFTYRYTPITSWSSWPIIGYAPGIYADGAVAGFSREGVLPNVQKYVSAFLSDTLTFDRVTLNLGLRYDAQWGKNLAATLNCCSWLSGFPEVPLRTVNLPGSDGPSWNDVSPRIGVTAALGPERKTLLKGSYARFVDQLGGVAPVWNAAWPIGAQFLYYNWNDVNHNNRVDPGEVDFDTGIIGASNVDPNHPNSFTPLNQTDPSFAPTKTDEFLLSVEHELMPAFVVSLTGTYRRFNGYPGFGQTAAVTPDFSSVLTPADYTCTPAGPYPLPDGSSASFSKCVSLPGVAGQGRLLMNRPGYNQKYLGVDFSGTKRYADRWMARFNFTWSSLKQYGLAAGQVDPSNLHGGSEVEGGPVVLVGKQFVSSRWQGTLSGMYTLPLDFNVSTSLYARDGFPIPYWRQVFVANAPAYEQIKPYQLTPVEAYRYPVVFEWDLGLSRVVRAGPLNVMLTADVFNVLNRNTVLLRRTRLLSTYTADGSINRNPSDNAILEIQSPRIWRFGVRLSF
jgi:Carboxypeptidase regulatory-like domain/TonB-dependent Receptor Plug Domain